MSVTVADHARRVQAVNTFLTEITEWGWVDAPQPKLLFRSDIPRLACSLPRYLPVDADRRLAAALHSSDHELAASALLLAQAAGPRIGELLDLELDCVYEIPGEGSWLKVPLGKLDTGTHGLTRRRNRRPHRPDHRNPLFRKAIVVSANWRVEPAIGVDFGIEP